MMTQTTRALLMALAPAAMLAAAPMAPAAAQIQVEHFFDYRFGVGYSWDPVNGGQSQPLYVGSYTARFTTETDNGLRFRFDLGVALGNIDPPNWRDGLRPPAPARPRD